MKTNAFKTLLLLATTAIATACSDGIEIKMGEDDVNSKVPKTITLKIAEPEGTRVDYDYDVGSKILKGNWKQGDAVRVFGNGTFNDYTATADGVNGESVTFGTTGTNDIGAGPYKIFYPAHRAGTTYETTIINMLGQEQTGATSTEHLKDFTVLTGEITNPLAPKSTEMQHRTAVLRFEFPLTGPTADFVRSITLSTENSAELTTIEQAANAAREKSKQLTLAVNTTEDTPLIAYMAVLPGEFTANSPIQILFTCKNNIIAGAFYKTTIGTGKKYEAGRVYNTKISNLEPITGISENTTAAAPNVEGKGNSEDDPIDIGSAENLVWMVEQINQGNYADKYFKLTTDIWIASSMEWTPIGTSFNPFKGHFDGGGHTISGTMMASADFDRFGFFGRATANSGFSGSIINLHVAADVKATSIATTDGGTAYGGIIGRLDEYGTYNITNCTYTGNIEVAYTGTKTGGNDVGGIVGVLTDYSTQRRAIERCQMVGSITIPLEDHGVYPGGIVGSNETVIHTSVAAVKFEGKVTGRSGQLAGWNVGTVYPCCWSPNTPLFGYGEFTTDPDTKHAVTP